MKHKICYEHHFTLIELEEELNEKMEQAKVKMLINRISSMIEKHRWLEMHMYESIDVVLNKNTKAFK